MPLENRARPVRDSVTLFGDNRRQQFLVDIPGNEAAFQLGLGVLVGVVIIQVVPLLDLVVFVVSSVNDIPSDGSEVFSLPAWPAQQLTRTTLARSDNFYMQLLQRNLDAYESRHAGIERYYIQTNKTDPIDQFHQFSWTF